MFSLTLQNLHTDNSQHFTLRLCSIRQRVSHVLCLAWAGGELCPAGQAGGSQADAGEAGHPTARCQEHVQADGHSAQQNALL